MKLRKALTGVKRYEQLDLGEPLPDRLGDPGPELVEPLPRLGGDQHRLGVTQRELAALVRLEQIDLVHHQQPGRRARADLVQDGIGG